MRLTLTANERARFWAKVDRRGDDDCWEWTAGRLRGGYGAFKVAGRMAKAHRVSFALANGGKIQDDKPCVCHACDNPPCVNPRHLFAGTQADNMRDRDKKGRARSGDKRGERNGFAKLTAAQVRAIRAACAGGGTQTAVARRFSVSRGAVANIVRRETWAHIA